MIARLRLWITQLVALFQRVQTFVGDIMPRKTKESVVAPVREVPVAPDEETVVEPSSALDDPNHPVRWKHRRRMAYTALVSMLVLTAYAVSPWIDIERLDKLSDVIEWFYFAMASIVGAYMGFATWAARTSR